MDAKITLRFDQAVANRAKEFASDNNISLSRLTEYLLRKVTEKPYKNLEEMPISDWVMEVAEERAEYNAKRRSRQELKSEFYNTKR